MKWLPNREVAHNPAPKEPTQPSAVAAVDDTPLWDRAGMLARLMDDEDLVTTILEMFLTDIPQQIQALAGFLDAGDAPGVERQAHTIKGAAANVGGQRLQRAASNIETAGKAGDLSAARTRLPEMEAQFTELKNTMESRNA